ncbi:MAG: glutamate formimidoyltransferase [Planctomycetota bacterium]|jgi:glutamate formiminotransferase/formiminotetrahydrofolate cyclodeaminase
MDKLVECVPNFSEGRDRATIDKITAEITAVEGVSLLDVDPGADTNRTVVTFLGAPDAAVEAAFRAIARAAELIDMRQHKGAHPRQGATDVCPFVPVAGVTMEDCVELARRLGKRVGEELEIPVYLYEAAASRPERQSLADIRVGEYEALAEKLTKPEFEPDFGPAKMNETAGATVIGAREFLIAYNVNLNTRNHKKANAVAFDVRTKGRAQRDADGNVLKDEEGDVLREPGSLTDVRGIGWYIDEYKMAQISMNLTNYKVTPMHVALEEVRDRARDRGLIVTGSELVGLVPRQAMLEAGRYYLRRQKTSPGQPEEEVIRVAVQSMGLEELKPFDPKDKIVDYRAGLELAGTLMRLTARGFLNELSTDSPAPGGGSVAALAGSLSAGLATMVANLTTRNKAYKEVKEDMYGLAERGQAVKDRLCLLVDEDTNAFNRLLESFRLPKGMEEEERARQAAIQKATRDATLVPFTVMETSLEALALAREVAERGMKASASDAGVAALMARAAVEGAYLNVKINVPNIEDREWVAEHLERAEEMSNRAREEVESVLETVNRNIAASED